MKLTPKEKKYWNQYLDENPEIPRSSKVEASIAGNLEIADQLLELYLNGKKYAGSGLEKNYIIDGEELPKVGNHWIILNSEGEPKCIVKTIRVEVRRLDQVTEEVAIAEGEGDLSLDFWRKAHIEFFTPFLEDWKISDLNQENVVTEFFELVFK